MYITWKGTSFNDVVKTVIKKCNQRNIINAVVKGGKFKVLSLFTLSRIGFHKSIENDLHTAPCIISNGTYDMPSIFYLKNKVFYRYIFPNPYSHPLMWKLYFRYIDHGHICNENTKELNIYHITAAKGVSSLFSRQLFNGYHLPCAKTKDYIYHITYFFNHSWPFERHVPSHNF